MEDNLQLVPNNLDSLGENIDKFVKSVCGELYYYNGLKRVSLVKNEMGNTQLSVQNYSSETIKTILKTSNLGNEAYSVWARYIQNAKQFISAPHMTTLFGVYDVNNKKMNHPKTGTVNLKTGSVYYVMDIPEKEPDGKPEVIHELLEIIFEDNIELIEDWLALMTLQYRTQARPTLVLTGVRGTGKSLFAETIVSYFCNGSIFNLPKSYDTYTGYLSNRVVIGNERDKRNADLMNMESFSKQVSTQERFTIRKMRTDPYEAPAFSYLILTSNKNPITITDRPQDETSNQFIVCDMSTKLNSKVEFAEFKSKYGNDVRTSMKKHIGAYIHEYLIPRYERNIVEAYKKGARYGMLVPITEAEMALFNSHTVESMEGVDNMLVDIEANMSLGIDNIDFFEKKKYLMHAEIWTNERFLTAWMVNAYKTKGYGVYNNSVKKWITEHKLGSGELIKVSVNSVVYIGYQLDRNLFDSYEDEFNSVESLDDLPF